MPEPEPEPEPRSMAALVEARTKAAADNLREQRERERPIDPAAAAVDAEEEQWRRKEAQRREALATYEERMAALAESQAAAAAKKDKMHSALTSSLGGTEPEAPVAPVRPTRSREESKKVLQTAQATLDAILDESRFMSAKLGGHSLPVLIRESPLRKADAAGQAHLRIANADAAAAEAEDWQMLVAETDCRAMARRTAPPPSWITGGSPTAPPRTSLYATAEYAIKEGQPDPTAVSLTFSEAGQRVGTASSGSAGGGGSHGRYAAAVLKELVDMERTGELQPTGLLDDWGATTIQRSFRSKKCSRRGARSVLRKVG